MNKRFLEPLNPCYERRSRNNRPLFKVNKSKTIMKLKALGKETEANLVQ